MANLVAGYLEGVAPVGDAGSPYAVGSPSTGTPIPPVAVATEVENLVNSEPSDTLQGIERIAVFEIDWTDITAATNVESLGPLFPDNALIIGAFADVTAAFTSAASTAEIGLGFTTDAATSIQSSAAVSGAPWSTTGRKTLTLAAAAAGSAILKLSAERRVLITRGVQALTAGHMVLFVRWIQSV